MSKRRNQDIPPRADEKELRVGSRVRLYWDGEKSWFYGHITQFRFKKRKCCFVKYDDGEEAWEDPKEIQLLGVKRVKSVDIANKPVEKMKKKTLAEKGAKSNATKPKKKKSIANPSDESKDKMDIVASKNPADSIGQTVLVYWDGEKKWYKGVVKEVKKKNRCKIQYEDGDITWEQFGNLKFSNTNIADAKTSKTSVSESKDLSEEEFRPDEMKKKIVRNVVKKKTRNHVKKVVDQKVQLDEMDDDPMESEEDDNDSEHIEDEKELNDDESQSSEDEEILSDDEEVLSDDEELVAPVRTLPSRSCVTQRSSSSLPPRITRRGMVSTSKDDLDLGSVAIGRRVKVFWDGEKSWFSGSITRVDSRKGYRVCYDDGDIAWELFKDVIFLSEDKSKNTKNSKAKKLPPKSPIDTSSIIKTMSNRSTASKQREDINVNQSAGKSKDNATPSISKEDDTKVNQSAGKSKYTKTTPSISKEDDTKVNQSAGKSKHTKTTPSISKKDDTKVNQTKDKSKYNKTTPSIKKKSGNSNKTKDYTNTQNVTMVGLEKQQSKKSNAIKTEAKHTSNATTALTKVGPSFKHGAASIGWEILLQVEGKTQQLRGSILLFDASKGCLILFVHPLVKGKYELKWFISDDNISYKKKSKAFLLDVLSSDDEAIIGELVQSIPLDPALEIQVEKQKLPLLVAFAYQGYNDCLLRLYDKCKNANIQSLDGSTPLMMACKNGHFTTAKYIVGMPGLKINLQNRQQLTALMVAAMNGFEDITRLLLNVGADASITNKKGLTALDLSCSGGHVKIIVMLLNHGSKLSVTSLQQVFRLIHDACSKGKQDSMNELIQASASVVKLEPQNATFAPLNCAVQSNIIEVVRALLAKGVDPNACCVEGMYPIMEAIRQGNVNIFDALLDAGALLGKTLESGATIFSWACSTGCPKPIATRMIDFLTKQKENITPLLQSGLMAAVENGQLELINQMVDCGVDVDMRDENGWCALKLASFHGNTSIVETLLNAGVDVNHTNNHGQSALMWSSVAGRVDVVALLLQNGAESNVTDLDGQTPLTWAIRFGHEEVVKVLIDGGADVNFKAKPKTLPCQKGFRKSNAIQS